jgi:hypothetical protein
MRTILILLVLVIFVSSALMADRPAMRSALEGLLGNSTTDSRASGNPATNRIRVPIPIALGRFGQTVKIFPVVTVVDGDAKDMSRAQAALRSELQKVAFRCNFLVVTGIKAPAGSLTFALTVVKDRGQSSSNSNRSSSDSWGGTNRHGSSSRSESSSSSVGGESTFVGTSASGGLDLNENDGSTTGLAYVDNIFSGNSERTGSASGGSSNRSYSYSNRRGSSYSSDSLSESESYRSDPEYSRSQSSRVTISEAVEKAVYCVLSQGIDYFNLLKGKRGAAPAEEMSPAVATGGEYVLAYDE